MFFRLKEVIRTALVDRVVEDLMDVVTPLKQFSDCVVKPNADENARNEAFEARAANLSKFSNHALSTAKMVAVGSNSGNKKVAEALLAQGAQCESLTPQLINAGRIRMVYPDNKAAEEHFENLRAQFAEGMSKIRGLCDDATDSLSFVQLSAKAVKRRSENCDEAVREGDAVKLIENTSAVARLCNRIIQVTKQEAENSEDGSFSEALNPVAERLQEGKKKISFSLFSCNNCPLPSLSSIYFFQLNPLASPDIAPVITAARALALDIGNKEKHREWRTNVDKVRRTRCLFRSKNDRVSEWSVALGERKRLTQYRPTVRGERQRRTRDRIADDTLEFTFSYRVRFARLSGVTQGYVSS